MRINRTPIISLCLAAAFLLLTAEARAQASDGVFIGKGRVARKDARGSQPAEGRAEDDPSLIAGEWTLRDIELLEQQCLDEVNKQREARGLRPLEFSKELLSVARYYSRRMAEEGFFAHADPEGRTVRQRVNEAGIRWRVLGENLAYSNGYTNPVAASVSGWMSSEGHRRNILAPDFQVTAIGVWVSEKGTVYFTEIFLRP